MTATRHVGHRALAAFITASLALLATPASTAYAAAPHARSMPSGLFSLRNANNGQCLEADADGDLSTQSCDGRPEQRWHSDNDSTLQNTYSGQCVEDFGNGEAFAVSCDGSPTQDWDYAGYKLINQGSGACLAGRGFVYTTSCSRDRSEDWYVGK